MGDGIHVRLLFSERFERCGGETLPGVTFAVWLLLDEPARVPNAVSEWPYRHLFRLADAARA
jgi:hypothetical protein